MSETRFLSRARAFGNKARGDRGGEQEPARHPVGQLTGREGDEEQRNELGETDESEVERVAVDRVDLPTHRDADHLDGDPAREDRDEEEREVALTQGFGQLPAPIDRA